MNKETFLKELSERLQVLNEKERQDVLEEYAQHIDLKIENGQSEEEAVRDFGTPEELCEELLDVYHINAEYASGISGQEQPEEKHAGMAAAVWKRIRKNEGIKSEGEKKQSDILSVFHGKKAETADLVKTDEELLLEQEEKRRREEERQARAQEKKQQRQERQLEKSEQRKVWIQQKKEEHAEKVLIKKEKRVERKNRMSVYWEECRQKRIERRAMRNLGGGSMIGNMIFGICSAIGSFCRFCWKICLFCAAVPVLMFALLVLFCTGTVAVLLHQGYPLIGITLLGAGGFLAAAGLSGLLLSYVFTAGERKQSKSADEG